jgi:hypothetical protein
MRSLLARLAIVSVLSTSLVPSPATAASSATTGVVAGLGITAASGKSTVSSGGAIEASLLTSDAILKVGANIATLVAPRVGHDPVILLGHSDTLDLNMARWLPMRLRAVQTQFDSMIAAAAGKCVASPLPAQNPTVEGRLKSESVPVPAFAPTDITAAVMTDYSISGVTLTADDRMLVNAVEMSKNGDTEWHDADKAEVLPKPGAGPHFVVIGERIEPDLNAPLLRDLAALQASADRQRHCTSAEYKAAVSVADAFISSVSASDKGTPAILSAVALAPYVGPDTNTHVLRIAIKSIGGTAVARSNIWYALGFPGAVTIGSGLLVSFRLFNARSGKDELLG